MLSKLWSYTLAVLGAVIAGLWWLLRRAAGRAEKAERETAAVSGRRRTERGAEAARRQAEEQGDEDVKQAVDRARAGHRDHFE